MFRTVRSLGRYVYGAHIPLGELFTPVQSISSTLNENFH